MDHLDPLPKLPMAYFLFDPREQYMGDRVRNAFASCGFEVWSGSGLTPEEHWAPAFEEAVSEDRTGRVFLLLTPWAMESEFFVTEALAAKRLEDEVYRISVFFLMMAHIQYRDIPQALRPLLDSRAWYDMTSEPFEPRIRKLVEHFSRSMMKPSDWKSTRSEPSTQSKAVPLKRRVEPL